MTEDLEIIELYINRDERAINETAKKYGAYCKTIAHNILLDRFDSEECVDDTYLRAWNSIPPTIPRILSAFLAKITRNLAIDRYNQKKAEKRSGYTESLEELSECLGGKDFSEEMEISEIGKAISDFLYKESEIARRIFIRRYFFQDSIEQIAKNHKISVSKVKTTLHRTRVKLAKYLEKEGIFI